jgi:hypothetical protein
VSSAAVSDPKLERILLASLRMAESDSMGNVDRLDCSSPTKLVACEITDDNAGLAVNSDPKLERMLLSTPEIVDRS